MRIAILTHSFLPKQGGAEIFHHNLACRLVNEGDDVTIVLPRKVALKLRETGWHLPYKLAPFPGNTPSLLRRCPLIARTVASWRLSRLQRRYHFDLWHGVMLFPTGVLLAPWAQSHRIPHLVRTVGDDLISSPDGSIGIRRNPSINRLIARALPRLQALVVLSDTMHKEAVRMGISPERVHILPNAVDTARFTTYLSAKDRTDFRIRHNLHPQSFLFIASGRNHPQKNYPALLKAAALLSHRDTPPFQILILGRDTNLLLPQAAALGISSLVRTAQISPVTTCTPEFPSADLILALRSADVFLMPSVLEGFSTALLEAMAAGLPVITTDAPGCADFTRNGQDALLVPINNPEALADAMFAMMTTPALRSDYSKRSLARAAQFDWQTVIASYQALYRSLLPSCRRPAAPPPTQKRN